MAPSKSLVAVALFLAVLLSSGNSQQAALLGGHAVAAPPAPLLIGGADSSVVLGTLASGVTSRVVADGYIGCLEMGFSRCFGDPTLVCVEDAMIECSLQAAAAPAATTTGPAAPLPGGGAAAELILGAVGGIIGRGITTVGAKYLDCVEVDLALCFLDPTIECVEKAMASC